MSYPDTGYSFHLQVTQRGAVIFDGEAQITLQDSSLPVPEIVIENRIQSEAQVWNLQPENHRALMTSSQKRAMSNDPLARGDRRT